MRKQLQFIYPAQLAISDSDYSVAIGVTGQKNFKFTVMLVCFVLSI